MPKNQDQLRQSRSRRARRSDDFPVRQWLKVGAASAGMGAALLGFSLMGPSTGTAAADSTGESSPSAQSTSSTGAEKTAGKTSDSDDDSRDGAGSDAADDADTDDAADEDADVADDDTDEDAGGDSVTGTQGSTRRDTVEAEDPAEADTVTDDRPAKIRLVQAPAAPTAAEEDEADAGVDDEEEEPPAEIKQPPAPAPPSLLPRKTWDDIVADVLDRWSDDTISWIKTLPASDDTKANLEATMWAVRRTFFNQAPTLDPVQVEGLLDGEIKGKVNADDAEGDRIVYRLVGRPQFGTVVIDDEGEYTYTPGEGFLGVDTFRVMAIDAGLHINLLNPFRALGSSAFNLINQNAIRFEFTYDGDEWTDERRAKLEEVAASLQEYFRVKKAVTLTFNVNEEDESGTLASADSERISTAPGYWRTVVQNKLQTGEDANGNEADGLISWNWGDGNVWELGDDVSAEEFDFTSVAIHELMHAFGWGSTLKAPGENQGMNREEYDRFIVTADGVNVLTNLQWSTVNDPKLTGGDRGLYFGGSNAVEAYGGYLVPLRTSTIWSGGSSIHHLSDATFAGDDQKIMNSGTEQGPAPRVFSELELAILRDLGYDTVMPESPPYAPADSEEEQSEEDEEAAAPPAPRPPAPAPASLAPRKTWNEVVAQIVDSWSASNQAWVDSLDVDEARKAELEASFAAFKRTFLNQAPTVDPVQVTGLTGDEAITGRIDAEDADGDEISYRLVSGPRLGSVVLNDDGTYTYTPGARFDGVDSFRVIAIDAGLHVNLLNPLRGIGTSAFNLINHNAITFDFTFDGEEWTVERQDKLKEVAANLGEYFRVNRPVTLTFDVDIENSDDLLASAGSPHISNLPGYWRTVVQQKLLTGRDANGSKADGTISWNFEDHQWSLDGSPSDEEYDFAATAIHELMHAFGFLSSLGGPEQESVGANRSQFDRNIVTVRGTRVFFLGGEWATLNDPKLIGEDGALYFGGRNAVAANGGYLVPLFTPAEWSQGSSMSHLDDDTYTGDDHKIMNSSEGKGPATTVFSELELAILRDLGYHVVMPESPPYGMALLGFLFLARPRRKDKSVSR
ncbi:WD40 domain-containing protein [Mycolicibacterium aurum]|uniref:WD40 domain-containing protein n=1 Tax=Mycolicibacterium aurum TaxID=1791 RepID=A0A448J1M2_MYCAU|nr:Ig-like domain-containing protein [Mycolicibacterium aurum]VEG58696.1 WD40 domain-containing protein [Mycolicibacterium aurum]